jgi:hypothetical protein
VAIVPDNSEYGGQTITNAGWVHVNEDSLGVAAEHFTSLANKLRNEVIPSARNQMMRLSDSWEGSGSRAALDAASAIIDKHEANAKAADDSARQLRNMEASVVKTKNAVNNNAEDVQRDCESLNNANLRGEVRAQRIAERIASGVVENVDVVSANTVELSNNLQVPLGTPGADGKMPEAPPDVPAIPNDKPAVPDDKKGDITNPVQSPSIPPPPPPPSNIPVSSNVKKGGITNPVQGPSTPPPPQSIPPTTVVPPAAAAPTAPASPVPGAPVAPSLGGGSAPSGPAGSPGISGPGSPLSTTSGPTSGSAGGPSAIPASAGQGPQGADTVKAAAGQPTGLQPQTAPLNQPLANTVAAQPAIPTPPPAPAPIPDAPPPTPSAPAPTGTPAGHAAPPLAPSVGAAPAPGAPPAPSMPLGPPPTPPPAAPLAPPNSAAPAPSSVGPGLAPASAAGATSPVGAPAPVPVSAARAERDAITAAATAGALRRQSAGGSDPLQLARRIGAALNAEPNIDFGFFWVTALTQDGQIVVANSYGLGYIPDGVNLPEQVRMASADESVPLGERAKWATYPILAVQGWAQHHNLRLRAVVATEDQFKNFDPGTPKVTLRSDDIPESGKMQGRNRLAVIAPEAAARLAGVSASGLSELLPPAPSDTNPPVDETSNLWFEVMKPMMSTNPERGVAHLEAFVNYADHAQEQALYRAHTAPDAAAQRGAIADWVYWQHLSVLTSDALAGSAAK